MFCQNRADVLICTSALFIYICLFSIRTLYLGLSREEIFKVL